MASCGSLRMCMHNTIYNTTYNITQHNTTYAGGDAHTPRLYYLHTYTYIYAHMIYAYICAYIYHNAIYTYAGGDAHKPGLSASGVSSDGDPHSLSFFRVFYIFFYIFVYISPALFCVYIHVYNNVLTIILITGMLKDCI